MAKRHPRPHPGAADLQGDHRLAFLRRAGHSAVEGGNVFQAFDIKSNRCHPSVLCERLDVVGEFEQRLVARTDDEGERQGPLVHGHVEADVSALRDDRHAVIDAPSTVGGGEQAHPVETIKHAVTVGADDGHLPGRIHEFALKRCAFPPGFPEARGVADAASRTAGCKRANDPDAELPPDGDKGGVRGGRQVLDRRVTPVASNLLVSWVDDPDLAAESCRFALADGLREILAADEGDPVGIEKPPKVVLSRHVGPAISCMILVSERLTACPPPTAP